MAFYGRAENPAAVFPSDPKQVLERTCFQTGEPWSDKGDLRSDVALVYGIDSGLPDRIKTWRDQGYRIHVMTGVSWGKYQDFLYGRFDGINHEDEAQTVSDGRKSSHGGDVYYMCPSTNYGKFLCVGMQRALDAGAEAIHLEEPEFWVNAGYGEGFKREWQSYYGEPWQAQDTSVDAQWRSSKLKYFLYRRALQQVFDYVQNYNAQSGRHVRCYVPTHSLLNYAHWCIVSPESSLARLKGCDGYIAQVWTGTARTPNYYEGRRKERTFETAFLEYGAMQNLVRASGRRVWYLNDPIEDNPNHDWEDYRTNWESTLTASLLQPEVWHYEIMPWPDRIFNGRHPLKSGPGESAAAAERVGIPKPYETELQTVITTLGDMKQKDTRWESAGTANIGVLVSDTMMFQRADPNPSDANLGSFYGLAMPLLKRGVPIEPVQIESATTAGFLDRYKLLVLTYEGQKPPRPEFHDALAKWVRQGGALVVVDDDKDPYLSVREWWNTAPHSYTTPRRHLFEKLDIAPDGSGVHRVGRGAVVREVLSPAALTYQGNGAEVVRSMVRRAAAAVKLPWKETNVLALRRGPYIIAAGLDESVAGAQSYVLRGRYLNLFDPNLTLLESVTISPGVRMLLVDLDKFHDGPKIVAAACRVREERVVDNLLRFRTEGIADTNAVVGIATRAAPAEILIDDKPLAASQYDFAQQFLRVRFKNSVEPVAMEVRWRK